MEPIFATLIISENCYRCLRPMRIGCLAEGNRFVSFMHYDLGYIDLEQRTLQTIDNPFGTRLSPMS